MWRDPRDAQACRKWALTEEMMKKLQITQRQMMRRIIQTNRKSGKRPAAAHAASVDDVADDDDSELDDDTTDPTPLTPPPSKKKVATTQTATPSSTKFQTTSQKTNWNQGSTTQCEQRTKPMICRKQMAARRGSSDRAGYTGNRQERFDDRWTKLISNWNPAISTKQTGCLKQGRPAKRWENDINAPPPSPPPNAPEQTETTTTLRATRLGSPRHKMARNETLWKATL